MLKTNVDKLLNILKEKKEVMISDLAAMLNTTSDNIEKIAKLLEEEKLVTIRYKMMKPYLVYGFKEKRKKKKEKKEIKLGISEVKGKKPLFMWKGKPISLPNLKLFSKLLKKKKKEMPSLKPKPISTMGLPTLKKKPLFSKLFKKKKIIKKPELGEVKEAIQKAKGIRLEKKPIKLPILKPKPFPRPFELKKEKNKIETEEDIKREIDDLIKEVKKEKDKTMVRRNYKKALALYSKLKDADNKINYNKKLKDLYDELTK